MCTYGSYHTLPRSTSDANKRASRASNRPACNRWLSILMPGKRTPPVIEM